MSASNADPEGFEPLTFEGAGAPDPAAAEARLVTILRRAVEDASEAIVVTEARLEKPGPRILWVNPAFTEITGYERGEVLGRTPRILQGPDTEEAVLRRLRERLQAGERFEGEATNYRKDGTPFVNHWSIAPVHDADGSVAYWVSIQRDVTDKRRLEREVLSIQEEERRRIGRDLHDAVGSALVSTSMRMDNLLDQQVEDEALAERLRGVQESIREAYEELRGLSQGLSPVDLSEGSLTIALEHLAGRTPTVRLEPGDVDLDAVLADWSVQARAHLYRIVKEAVANALKHADAEDVAIRWAREDRQVLLIVEDDGTGFVPAAAREEGWGLRTMTYRADLVGADLEVESAPGRGTRVTCRLPV